MFCCGALHLHPGQPPQPGIKATPATSTEGTQPEAASSRPHRWRLVVLEGCPWAVICVNLGSTSKSKWKIL